MDGIFRYASSRWFAGALRQLAAAGVHGVAVDVWVRGPPCEAWLPLVQPGKSARRMLTLLQAVQGCCGLSEGSRGLRQWHW